MNGQCQSASQPVLAKQEQILTMTLAKRKRFVTIRIFTLLNFVTIISVTLKNTRVEQAVKYFAAKRKKKQDQRLTSYMPCQLISHNTFRFGVKGSGSLMFRGKALRMRFLIWMQLGGMTSQKLKW